MSMRESFVKEFGEENALAIEGAAEEHNNNVHDRVGSDPFRWAILICLGFECISNEKYAKYHGITAKWPAVQSWLYAHAYELANHDGDIDYTGAFYGVYDFIYELTSPMKYRKVVQDGIATLSSGLKSQMAAESTLCWIRFYLIPLEGEMKGSNLPESTGPNDPEAPWNKDEDQFEPVFTCQVCGREFGSVEDEEACAHTCYACHEEG